MEKIFLIFIFLTSVGFYSFEQSSYCDLFIDELHVGDTLKITLNFWSNRNHREQNVFVFKDDSNEYFAVLTNDSLENHKVKLSKSKVSVIKNFEIGIRSQELKGDAIIVHTLAEYELRFGYGRYYFYSKEIFYDLLKELVSDN